MRFECRNATLNIDKFWTFEIQDLNRVAFAYGRRGTAGQTMTKTYETTERLTADLERLMRAKLEKGYLPVEDDGDPAQNIEVFGLRVQRSIMDLAARERGNRWMAENDVERARLAVMASEQGREQGLVMLRQRAARDKEWARPLQKRSRAACPHVSLIRDALVGYICNACGETIPAGPPAAPPKGILVAVKTKRRITFDD